MQIIGIQSDTQFLMNGIHFSELARQLDAALSRWLTNWKNIKRWKIAAEKWIFWWLISFYRHLKRRCLAWTVFFLLFYLHTFSHSIDSFRNKKEFKRFFKCWNKRKLCDVNRICHLNKLIVGDSTQIKTIKWLWRTTFNKVK